MKVGAIDAGRIEAMMNQLKLAAQKNSGNTDAVSQPNGMNALSRLGGTKNVEASTQVDFSSALKASLDAVNQSQVRAEQLSKNFVLGDDSVSLSDVMIAGQKANITFQATVQVRNKLVSAYSDIMNMQV